jgi:hypothetical protein
VQRSTWPPSCAVRHASIAAMTRRSVRPWRRKMSATSKAGMTAAGQAGPASSSFSRSNGLAVLRIVVTVTCV